MFPEHGGELTKRPPKMPGPRLINVACSAIAVMLNTMQRTPITICITPNLKDVLLA